MPRRYLFAPLFLIPVGSALACTCVPPREPAWHAEMAQAVFVGEVLEVRPLHEAPPGNIPPRLRPAQARADPPLEVEFRVIERFKAADKETMTVRTAGIQDLCGVQFKRGVRYVVYAHEWNGHLRASRCDRTGPVDDPGTGIQWLRAHRDRIGGAAPPAPPTICPGATL